MVQMREMSEQEYEHYRGYAVPLYASEIAKSTGATPGLAEEFAAKQFQDLLPAGRKTENHFFFRVTQFNDGYVGDLWFCTNERFGRKTLFICDIMIAEEYRGKGYGTETLKWLETKARELGARRITLHVFGHNTGARKLYESLGYASTNINMRKDLE